MKAPHFLRDERGFGMVEALISMLLLAIVAMAFLPMLITGMKAATLNTTVTTATQAVNEQLSPISTREFTCTEIQTWLSAPQISLTDPRGTTIYLHRSAGADSRNPDGSLLCNSGGTVTLQVSATNASTPAAAGASTYASAGTIVRIE